MKFLKFTSIGLLSVLAFQNIAVACDAYCAKRFSVKYKITVPAEAITIGGDKDPNLPTNPPLTPEKHGVFNLWIDKSVLDADYGDGISCKDKPAINVSFLYRDFDDAMKIYKGIQEQVSKNQKVTLTLVGDHKYLTFHQKKPHIKYCALFIKAF